MFSVLAVVLAVVACASAHSHLANPLPTRRLDCRIGNRRARPCRGPCPLVDTYGRPTGITATNPAATWRRGEKRSIGWHRNNHARGESGFVRLSLVPVAKMYDKNAHARYTFQKSCWSAGLHRCKKRSARVCGNDQEGMAYRVPITVPTSYPDGVYALGWAWYGGGDYRGRSFFGDYYSCSFVRIRGGARVTNEWKPVFVAGAGQKYDDGCLSATDRAGVCASEPCHVGAVRPIKVVGLPRAIYARDFGEREGPPVAQATDGTRSSNVALGARSRVGFKVYGMQVIDAQTRNTRNFDGANFRVRAAKYRKGFTLALRTSGRVASVRFEIRGYAHTEYVAPYVINGNSGLLDAFNVCRNGRTVAIRCVVNGIHVSKEFRYNMMCA